MSRESGGEFSWYRQCDRSKPPGRLGQGPAPANAPIHPHPREPTARRHRTPHPQPHRTTPHAVPCHVGGGGERSHSARGKGGRDRSKPIGGSMGEPDRAARAWEGDPLAPTRAKAAAHVCGGGGSPPPLPAAACARMGWELLLLLLPPPRA
uniref:Uncharacterized protein n=1 Tax=Oryza sativa subsp. japonica TaxID=39947 RepID=Q6EPG0_ORYSJ|nr:hypothetical protein [Oryza sativa Japonica Group]